MAYPNPPRTWSAGAVLTAAQMNAELRDALNTVIPTASTTLAWSTYTPTLAQGATSNIAKTVTLARYFQIGKVVHLNVNLAVTGTGTASAAVTVSLPVTMNSSYSANDDFGIGHITDSSAATKYRGVVVYQSTTTMQYLTLHSTANNNLGLVDFTAALASGDVVAFNMTYEAA